MPEELSLVTQFAIILIAAGVFTVLSKALKQPLILGYILAGFIVGPHLGLFPQFSPESVHQWSELGIIFLLFGLGLEFSLKKLMSVGSSAAITAGTICLGMFVIGIAAGSAMGWSSMESIFLGGLMSMSSTTIIIKSYDDLGIKNKPYASMVFGLLVVEDLIAVLLMVLLSTLAASNKFAGGEMVMALAKLVFFLIICFLVGIFVLPTLLRKARKYLSDEILLLVSVGLCFLLVVLANMAGFSSALGAFLMGSILSSTLEGERIRSITGSIKDLFGAIFFVSVGMMVDPTVIIGHWTTILTVTLVAMIGILLCSMAGVLLAGKSLDTAIHVGFSLPQLGEFSFIIASLGCTLGVMREFIYPVIIAVSVITTFTTPYMIKAADPVSVWLHRNLPDRFLSRFNSDKNDSSAHGLAEQNGWKVFLKMYFTRVGLYSIILIAILLAAEAWIDKLFLFLLPSVGDSFRYAAEVIVLLVIMSPFVYGLAVNGDPLREQAKKLVKKDAMAKWPIIACILLRIFLAVFFVMSPIVAVFTLPGWKSLLIFLGVAIFLFCARMSSKKYNFVEKRFISNLNAKEEYDRKSKPVISSVREKMSGYDVHIEAVCISPDFSLIGKTLREMPFRHNSSVNILKIQRGAKSILVPSGGEFIYPGDIILAVGTSSQLESFREEMERNIVPSEPIEEEFSVDKLRLDDESELVGKSLRESGMRDNGCIVISIEHDGKLITNPGPDYILSSGEIVWIAGLVSSINWYK